MKKLLILLVLLSEAVAIAGTAPTRSPTNFISITLSASRVEQGKTLTVFVNSAHRLKQIELLVLNQKLPMYHMWNKEHKHLFRAFAGIPIQTRPGKYKVVVNAVDVAEQPLLITPCWKLLMRSLKSSESTCRRRKRNC